MLPKTMVKLMFLKQTISALIWSAKGFSGYNTPKSALKVHNNPFPKYLNVTLQLQTSQAEGETADFIAYEIPKIHV
uniref:Secreted protein n=1 Tax=Megaselia scalaris TaxID=36166 RepID=T1GNT2_MEGSC